MNCRGYRCIESGCTVDDYCRPSFMHKKRGDSSITGVSPLILKFRSLGFVNLRSRTSIVKLPRKGIPEIRTQGMTALLISPHGPFCPVVFSQRAQNQSVCARCACENSSVSGVCVSKATFVNSSTLSGVVERSAQRTSMPCTPWGLARERLP